LRAASREKGAELLPPRLKEGGSMREKGPAVRRRLDKIPERLPRVGERPAGAERGDDLEMVVLSLAAGDLGWMVRRGVEEEGISRDDVSCLGAGVALRTKLVGLWMPSLTELEILEDLERLADN
jgi:hypothetical protein